MLKSMTGYGRAVVSDNGYTFTVEMKAVNHRYREINCRMPKELFPYEEAMKKIIGEQIKRGRVDVYITIDRDTFVKDEISINHQLLEQYIHAVVEIQKQYIDVKGELTVSDILAQQDIIVKSQHSFDIDVLQELLFQGLEQALAELMRFRSQEGAQLGQDCNQRLRIIESYCNQIQQLSHAVVDEYSDRLTKRITEMLADNVEIDNNRIAAEVVIYAERSSIVEELVRLQSHTKQFVQFLGDGDAIGRKLDFLVQEMNREVNTIGSKSSHIEISKYVVELKSELEKIREQVQNIE